MIKSIFSFVGKNNHHDKYVKIIKDLYTIQYIYCEECIRNKNRTCKMHCEKNSFVCLDCNSRISMKMIRDDDFIFDNQELKEYLLKGDTYYKIKCLLIYWNQPKEIINNVVLVREIELNITNDNFNLLYSFDPNYLPV
jgi:hypothetical protein